MVLAQDYTTGCPMLANKDERIAEGKKLYAISNCYND